MRTWGGLVVISMLAAACGDTGAGPIAADENPPETLAPSDQGGPPTTVADTDPVDEPEVDDRPDAIEPSRDLVRAPVDPDAPVDDLVGGWNDAGFELLRRLPAADNVVFSPMSIGQALLMAAAAADDATRAAIEAEFGLPDAAHEAWNSLDQAIAAANSDRVDVAIAARMWPRVGLQPDQEWVDLLAREHGVDAVALDFENDPDGSRDVINDWVGDRTRGLIPELLPVGSPKPATQLVLTNAVYFEADWRTIFGKYGTVDATFTTLDGAELDVTFMRELELEDRRGIGEGFAGVEIPYSGDDYSMLVLVPDEGRYEEVIERLDQELLAEIDAAFTTGPFELLLPKWAYDYRIDLIEWLGDIGAAPGSYPKIGPDTWLDVAVHAADISVDEQGTVAAAATALEFPASGPPEPELTIAADRPFVYLIRHRPSGLVLFVGQVTDPTT